jgi:hypothetical protein
MTFDQLIRNADPAADITIPDHDSLLALESFERVLATQAGHRPARRRKFVAPASVAVVAAVAAAITLIVSITPGVAVSPAAAAVLNQAAAVAGREKPLVLQAGQYLYTRTQSLSDASWTIKHRNVYPEYVETDQSWLTARGAGKDILTVNSPVTFANGSRAAWIAAGRPRLFAHDPGKPFVSWYTAPKAGSGPEEPIGTGVPLDNLSHLPTNPAALAQLIERGKTGLADISADIEDPSKPAGAFLAAMFILTDESVGGSPALRSALFKVMAEQPGIKLIGHARTRSGRTGVGLLTPALASNGIDIFKVIIDPRNGQVLEYDEYARAGQPAEQWTEYLNTAVVKKIGQLPHG